MSSRRRRRLPDDLHVHGRLPRAPADVPRALPERHDHPARGELPLLAAGPHRRERARPFDGRLRQDAPRATRGDGPNPTARALPDADARSHSSSTRHDDCTGWACRGNRSPCSTASTPAPRRTRRVSPLQACPTGARRIVPAASRSPRRDRAAEEGGRRGRRRRGRRGDHRRTRVRTRRVGRRRGRRRGDATSRPRAHACARDGVRKGGRPRGDILASSPSSSTASRPNARSRGVQLMTYHRAKGLSSTPCSCRGCSTASFRTGRARAKPTPTRNGVCCTWESRGRAST